MEDRSMTEQLLSLLDDLAYLLVPPFSNYGDRVEGADRLARWILVQASAEAAALFLVDEDHPTKLRYVSGVGYHAAYRSKTYSVDEYGLTPHVFRTKAAINASHEELKRSDRGIPFTGACEDVIETKRFNNIVAVPVTFDGNPLGVLKIENKRGTSDSERFPERDLALANLVAKMVAMIWQQRIYTSLWIAGEELRKRSESRADYIKKVSGILKNALNAECCAVFLVNQPGTLQYAGGSGYRESYESHQYQLPAAGERADSLTTYVATMKAEICKTRAQLEEQRARNGIPFSGRCAEFIPSGQFRNILALPIVDSGAPEPTNGRVLGVLKLENRLPEGTAFSHYDLELCKAFVNEQVVPRLNELADGEDEGLGLLIKMAGPPIRYEEPGSAVFWARFEKVLGIWKENKRQITGDICGRYFGISRSKVYALEKRFMKEHQQGNA